MLNFKEDRLVFWEIKYYTDSKTNDDLALSMTGEAVFNERDLLGVVITLDKIRLPTTTPTLPSHQALSSVPPSIFLNLARHHISAYTFSNHWSTARCQYAFYIFSNRFYKWCSLWMVPAAMEQCASTAAFWFASIKMLPKHRHPV